MKTNTLGKLTIWVATALASTALIASPMVTISDNSAIYFKGSASITSDSNVAFDENNEIDDIIYQLKPGFQWITGSPETGAQFTIDGAYAIMRYSDADQFDTELPSIVVNGVFQGPKMNTRVNAGYVENQANSRNANAQGILLESASTSAELETDYQASAKTSVVAGVSFLDYNQKTQGSDRTELVIPVNVYYASTEKLDIGLGYRYRNTSVDVDPTVLFGDRTSHFINVALRGELTPKVTADVKLGFQSTDVDGADDFSGFGADASLRLAPDAKSLIVATLSKDYLVGFAGEVIDNFTASLFYNYSVNLQWSANAELVYASDDFELSSREQDFTYAKVGVSYVPSEYLSIDGNYTLLKNDSTLDGGSFDSNILSLSVNVRY